MTYMLHKQAEATNKRALIQTLGAVGGGAAGYLLTRYGLGIKGAGAGLAGTGIGAVVGAAGAGELADYGDQDAQLTDKDVALEVKNKDLADDTVIDSFGKHLTDPTTSGTGAMLGAAYAGRKGIGNAVKRQTDSALADFSKATKGTATDVGSKWLGKLTPNMQKNIGLDIKASGRGANHALEALATASQKKLNPHLQSSKIRGMRGIGGAITGAMALPALLAAYSKKVAQPDQRAWLDDRGVEWDK